MMAAIRSIDECMASDIMLTDPLISPTVSFNMISNVLDIIERRATLTLAFMRIVKYQLGSNLVVSNQQTKNIIMRPGS